MSLELSTTLSTVLLIVGAGICIFAIGWALHYCRRCADFAEGAAKYVHTQNKNSLSLARMAEVEATLTELKDSYTALLTSHKKLRSRIGMREHRGNGKSPESRVDSTTRDKTLLRQEAKKRGILK